VLVLLFGEESGEGDDVDVDLLLPDRGRVVAVHDGGGESIDLRRGSGCSFEDDEEGVRVLRELVGQELCAERQECVIITILYGSNVRGGVGYWDRVNNQARHETAAFEACCCEMRLAVMSERRCPRSM